MALYLVHVCPVTFPGLRVPDPVEGNVCSDRNVGRLILVTVVHRRLHFRKLVEIFWCTAVPL